MDSLEAQTYGTFEKDTTKYIQAAEETGRKLKIYVVEKNPNAVITLHMSNVETLVRLNLTLKEMSKETEASEVKKP
ncbi:hypothetical protein V2J09_008519 [Rumex salicifolius]